MQLAGWLAGRSRRRRRGRSAGCVKALSARRRRTRLFVSFFFSFFSFHVDECGDSRSTARRLATPPLTRARRPRCSRYGSDRRSFLSPFPAYIQAHVRNSVARGKGTCLRTLKRPPAGGWLAQPIGRNRGVAAVSMDAWVTVFVRTACGTEIVQGCVHCCADKNASARPPSQTRGRHRSAVECRAPSKSLQTSGCISDPTPSHRTRIAPHPIEENR